jgi:GNAT superfamily N-acetyltransferase
MTPVVISYLEMLSTSELVPKASPSADFRVAKAGIKNWRLNKFFYAFVGNPWSWTDKQDWSDEAWQNYVESDALTTFIAYHCDTPVGYFELRRVSDEVEIAILGLEPNSVGMGFGGHLLSEAIRSSWDLKPNRVVVNTCTLDHPNALNNYLARGMVLYKREEKNV